MKRYLIHTKYKQIFLNLKRGDKFFDGVDLMASSDVITNEAFDFKDIQIFSVVLKSIEVENLKEKGVELQEDTIIETEPLLYGNEVFSRSLRLAQNIQRNNLKGLGKKICVMDTGCNPTGYTFVEGINIMDSNTNVTDIEPITPGHGSVMCSLVKHPIYGWAQDASLYVCKVYNGSGIPESVYVAGMQWAITKGCDAVTNSFSAGRTVAIDQAILDCYNAGCIPFIACGNSGAGALINDISSHPNCVTVGSYGYSGVSNGSLFFLQTEPLYPNNSLLPRNGKNIQIMAPGYAIGSINGAGGFLQGSGTSQGAVTAACTWLCYLEKMGKYNSTELTTPQLLTDFLKRVIPSGVYKFINLD